MSKDIKLISPCDKCPFEGEPQDKCISCELKYFESFKVEAESGWHLASDTARGLGVECDGDLGHEAEQIRKERDQLRKALWDVYKRDQHPNYDDPTSPIIGSLGKKAWKALNRTGNGG